MTNFEKVATAALNLPDEIKAELAELLIQSLNETEDEEIRSAWLIEIRKRDAEIKMKLPVTRPANEVLKEAREQLRCIT